MYDITSLENDQNIYPIAAKVAQIWSHCNPLTKLLFPLPQREIDPNLRFLFFRFYDFDFLLGVAISW